MHRIRLIISAAVLFGTVGMIALSSQRAEAQEVVVNGGVDVTVDPTIVIEPSDEYIATVAPVYYEGRPVYYYNNYWYYRDHGRWRYYRTEPGFLRERRVGWGYRGEYGYYRGGYQRGGYGRGGYERGGYQRGGYERGGYQRGGYQRGGYQRGGYARGGGGPGRYHYRR